MSNNCFIEKTDYGLYIRFVGRICKHDIEDWHNDLIPVLRSLRKKFSIIADLRDVLPLCSETAKMLGYNRAFLRGRGLERTAIVSSSSATLIELMKVFSETGYDPYEKHISSAITQDWRETAEAWVRNGIEP